MAKTKTSKSEKGLIIFIIIDCIAIAFFVYVILAHSGKIPKLSVPGTGKEITAVSSTSRHFTHSDTNSIYETSYETMISGTTYKTSKGDFVFGNDNKYSGYFDDADKSVKGAYYDLYYDDDNYNCNLAITYKKKMVWYRVSINKDNSISLIPFGDKKNGSIKLERNK